MHDGAHSMPLVRCLPEACLFEHAHMHTYTHAHMHTAYIPEACLFENAQEGRSTLGEALDAGGEA